MNQEKIQKLKKLKDNFQELSRKDRESIGVCFLKVKLGVHQPEEFDRVMAFLGDLEFEINSANLDSVMNFLHSTTHSLPEFLALEESLNDIGRHVTSDVLPPYNPDDAETLKEGIKPFKS